MKKIIALVLSLTLCASMMTACGNNAEAPESEATTEATATSELASAKEYLFSMYRKAPSTHVEDFKVVGKVMVGANSYDVNWTADSDTVKFVKGDDNMVTVDINEKNPEEVLFKLTATISDANGNTETVTFDKKVPAAIIIGSDMSPKEIVEAAYKLEDGIAMKEEMTLTGVVSKVNDAFNPKYKNVTLTIVVDGLTDKPIKCFRLSGEGVDTVKEGDEITVNGIIKNYKGEIEFDKGCKFLGLGEVVDQKAIVEAAYKLEDGISMKDEMTLTGVISKVNDAFNPKYKNVTVTIVVDDMTDKPIKCFRLAGEGADKIKEGDKITVTGILKNYKGEIEFDKGCKLDKVVAGTTAPATKEEPKQEANKPVANEDPAAIVEALYKLGKGEVMEGTKTITGKVVEIVKEYNPEYKNVTLNIQVGDMADKPVQCYRLSGEGADKLAVGDVITVTGTLQHFFKESKNMSIYQFDQGCTFVK